MRETLIRRASRLAAAALALALAGVGLPAAVAAAGPVTSTVVAAPAGKHHVKLQAGLRKSHVRVGEQVSVHGHLANLVDGNSAAAPRSAALYTEGLYLQEETSAGVWVDLNSVNCAVDDDFSLSVSFSVAATLQLRIFAPETDLYAAAYSNVFTLLVG
jgi:hypothetical protein